MIVKTVLSFFIFMALSLAHPVAWADFEQDLAATGNISPALRELHARALAGDAEAQLNMGGVFCKGQDVEQDYAECAKWFRLAARQGHSQAQFNLGMMYDLGLGTAQDHTEAVKWYRLAADQGLALAQLNLGVAYATGQGVLKNELDATRWLRLAADQGEAQAQFNLAVMYANGQGVKQNFTEAYRWARLAALQGHETAKALAQDLSRQMAPEQQAGNLADTAREPSASGSAVSAASAASAGTGDYYLQLAAFKSKKEAEKYLAGMLTKLGKIDKTLSIFTADGWVRTQMGPYITLNEARTSAASLKTLLGYEPLLKQH
ncbi:MAG: SPOR domain-containing protein [Gallionella sp.]|nr:SPOR domain-containing protein [Gallionella sp.]